MEKLPLEVQTLYAELVERLAAQEARRTIGHVAGSFVTKTVKGETYYYFQYLEPGGAKRQLYVGKKDEALDAVVERHSREREDLADDAAAVHRLASLLRTGGAMTADAASARVLRGLADAGVFHLGGVLVGTHAFKVIGNLLGVRWDVASLGTQDIDTATETRISVALSDPAADVPGVLESLQMGFLPVPALDRKRPSTSFKVRGKGLRVDLLAPARDRRQSAPVPIPRFKTAAQPLPYLDFVIEESVRAAAVDGGAVLVSVPEPARFALHKLIVSSERPSTMHSKREKDLRQAIQVFSLLADERPGDLERAWTAVEARGRRWMERAMRGLAAMAKLDAEVAQRVRESAGNGAPW